MRSHRLLRLMIVLGTRPEVVKLAPVVALARARPAEYECVVVSTSQHREMLDQMLQTFRLEVDVDLDIMRHGQSLADLTQAAIGGLDRTIARHRPDYVLVQGDTTTTFAGALAAFYHQVPVAHVEAGLRTRVRYQPFPEEVNRCLTTQLATLHFAPTEQARQNLLHDGIAADHIHVTGNTCIDALLYVIERRGIDIAVRARSGMLLLTAHRRENHGEPLERICAAVVELLERHPQVRVEWPVHLSPQVRDVVFKRLGDHPRVRLGEPLDYETFVAAMCAADIILTDSGGVQEEAPALNKPVLVLRETTERPEGLSAGTIKQVGTSVESIVRNTEDLLTNADAYDQMANATNPYGDGHAAERILDALGRHCSR